MATKYAKIDSSMNWNASTWGQAVANGSWNLTTRTLTPAISPGWAVDTLIGLIFDIGGVSHTCSSNTASAAVMVSSVKATGTYTWVLFNETAPGNGDTACLNGANVSMNIATIPATGTLAEINTKKTDGTVTSGSISVQSISTIGNCTINATSLKAGSGPGLGASAFIYVSGASSSGKDTLTINGTVIGGSGSNAHGVSFALSSGKLVINGSVTAGSASSIYGVLLSLASSLTITGDVNGGAAGSAHGIYSSTSGNTVIVNGNLYAGSTLTSGAGLYFTLSGSSANSITVNGNVYAGGNPASYGLYISGGTGSTSIYIEQNIYGTISGSSGTYGVYISTQNISTITIGGSIYGGGVSNAYGLATSGTTSAHSVSIGGSIVGGSGSSAIGCSISGGPGGCTMTVTGTVTGGSNISSHGISLSFGNLTVNNNVTGGSGGHGISLTGTTVIINGDVIGGGSGNGIFSSNNVSITINGNLIDSLTMTAYGGKIRWNPTSSQYHQIYSTGDIAHKVYKIPTSAIPYVRKAQVMGDITGTGQAESFGPLKKAIGV